MGARLRESWGMKLRIAAVVFGVALVASASVAEACVRKIPAKAETTIVPTKRINQSLFDDAVRAEVNYHRCRAGLPPLADAGSDLSRVAEGHSKWMAKTQIMSHKSTIPGRATLSQRVKSTGLRFRTGSENIGMLHRYQIDNQRFKILNSSACQFSTYGGKSLDAHSYASLARLAVDLWMNSPGHRKNILDRRAKATVTAIAFNGNAQYCGQFWLTQNFIG